MTATADQISRIARDWNDYANGEAVRIEQIGDVIYGFTSELGALRLLRKYQHNHNVRSDFSRNLGSWFFSMDLA